MIGFCQICYVIVKEEANAKKEKYIKKMAEEPSDQYGMLAFDDLSLGKGTESISDNTHRSI
ncbi:hypothetical protein [Borreliella valaisiana]|uniref:Virulent strain associated lipoprotein n=1 Tax=Borreliella valaisiana VS116 TaxID=445987 RepID=D6RWJ8_BORVA|nr:hypothetical protein [Borreliella valaisiana]EEF81459.1 virulent strain associated lipoprotein [Borreliella valaisiana VS116]